MWKIHPTADKWQAQKLHELQEACNENGLLEYLRSALWHIPEMEAETQAILNWVFGIFEICIEDNTRNCMRVKLREKIGNC